LEGGSITSPTLDPAMHPGSPAITQKSCDGTVPMSALPAQKSLAPVILGAVMTVAAAAAVGIFLVTRGGPVAPTSGSGVSATTIEPPLDCQSRRREGIRTSL
jgi:hypothetical protein